MDTFRCLKLALQAATVGGTAPTVLNAANEAAVGSFLEGDVPFLDIAAVVEETLDAHEPISQPDLEQVFAVDKWARTYASSLCSNGGR
jgi:1-deoxy-D-xylulose-5-phosphate reductoisomerase